VLDTFEMHDNLDGVGDVALDSCGERFGLAWSAMLASFASASGAEDAWMVLRLPG
jgi:hypothetical protein